MSGLTEAGAANRARAVKLHEHFCAIALTVEGGGKLVPSLAEAARRLDGMILPFIGGEMLLEVSFGTLKREWYYWLAGGRKGAENEAHIRRPEALLLAYKPGCGGHRRMPRELIAELQRRITLGTGGRDKHGKSPLSVAYQSLCRDFLARRPLPGIDYAHHAEGAEFPWCYETACRKKPSRGLRALGNLGASAHKGQSAYVSLDYSRLRKGELYTLDDVRLDVVCTDEATGRATEVNLYVLMEVGSRLIVDYVMVPSAEGEKVKQEHVDELLAHGLQTPGFGIGIGYTTHLLFERGSIACSDAAQAVLEGVTDGALKVHRTSMVGGVRWIGAARDKARGNAAGKAVIESFHRWLHYALLHLPGQRGNNRDNQPQNLGAIGGSRFTFDGKGEQANRRKHAGTTIDEAEKLAQFAIGVGPGRLRLKIPLLYLKELHAAVTDAVKRHNTEPGHEYRGHGRFAQEEVAPGVWRDADTLQGGGNGEPQDDADTRPEDAASHGRQGADTTSPAAAAGAKNEVQTPACPRPASARHYTLDAAAPPAQSPEQRTAIFFRLWGEVEKAKPGLNRFAIVARAIGRALKPADMTPEQFAQVCRVFSAIAREGHDS